MNRKVAFLHCNDLCNSGSWAVSRSERNTELSMNRAGCGSQTRGPDRASVRRSGSWSQCATEKSWRLPMNRCAALQNSASPEARFC